MALTNCTITSTAVDVTSNQAVGTTASQVLVITPDVGYVVKATDFSKQSPPTGIDTITLSDSTTAYALDNTVLVTCDLTNSYNPGTNDVTLTIDIDGAAVLSQDKGETRLTNVTTVETNTTSSSGTNSYTVTGTYDGVGDPVAVVTKTITATSGKYFTSEPSHVVTTGTADHYTITCSTTVHATYTDAILSKTFEIKYNFPDGESTNPSADVITITANADGTLITDDGLKLINSYTIEPNSISQNRTEGTLRVYGESGAQVDLAMVNEDSTAYNFTDLNFTGGGSKALTIPSNGYIDVDVVYPTTGDPDQYDFTLSTAAYAGSDLASGIDPDNNSIATFNVISYGTCGYTVSTNSASGRSYTSTPSKTHSGVALSVPSGRATFASSLVLTDDVNMVLRRLPIGSDFVGTNVDGSTSTSGSMLLDTVSINPSTIGGAGVQSYTITVSSEIDKFGIANSTHVLALDNFINVPTVAANATFAGNEDSNLSIDLSSHVTNPQGNTLTYSVVADNSGSNGTLGSINASTGAITYTPAANNNTNVTFTWRVNDGLENSNTATATLNIAAVADAPTDITMSSQSINENNSINDVIGAFSSVDPDGSGTYTYTLVSGTGSTDNSSFNISGSNLRAGEVFDYETKDSYSIRVRSTDADGSGNVEKQFTISIGDLADGGTGARWLIERYDSSGNTTNVQYYVSSTQYCNGSSLAVIPNSCFGLNKFVRFVTSAGGCGSTEYAAGKIINVSVSDGAIGAYISGSGAQWFNTAQDAHNDTNAVNC
ncbi:MAG: hypothetical protein CMM02_12035 [Rhodopirellula sp.]|mgnify:FL=1|jgi:hypothetical protein|nr:hypothetical protein [Rhodopirellula sp.]|tara:strand:+ start:11504 stop:13822 length:2319 start_codon:yes stop_codon:yes gene_type:complete